MSITTPAELSQADREKIINFLKSHPVGVLASVDPEGEPHASTIYFTADDDLNITFTTKRETRKCQNISQHSNVMLAVYEASSQTAVQLSGQAVEITDPESQHAIYQGTLDAARRTGEDIVPPIAKITAGPYVTFAIHIKNIWLSEYGWGDNFAKALKHAADEPISGDPS